MTRLRVGVVGAGFIGKQHIEAVRRCPGAEVLALADANPGQAATVAGQLAVPRHYPGVRDLLADPDIDVVHNCTPTAAHFAVNKAALQAGKHIYSEKPLTLTTDESRELAGLAAASGLAHGVNFNYRHNVMVKEMRDRVRSGAGRVLSVYGEYLQDWLLFDTDYDWRLDPALGGESRAVADIGSHCFDTAEYVLGRRIAAVYAHLITVHPLRKRCEPGETFAGGGKVLEEVAVTSEDAAYIMVRFTDGTPGLFHLSQVTAGKKNGLALTVSGGAYAMEWRQERADRLWLGQRDQPNQELYADARLLGPAARAFASLPAGHAVAWHDALRNGIAVFYQAIRDRVYDAPEPLDYPDFASGHRTMQVVDACLASTRSGTWVEVG